MLFRILRLTTKLELTNEMKQFVENLFAVVGLMGAEAWFLHGYLSGHAEFEPALLVFAAVGVLLAKDPLKERFGVVRSVRAHDREVFKEFQRVLPVEPAIRLLKQHDFGGAFRSAYVQPLYLFASSWDSVEWEFLDSKLEKERKALLDQAKDLVDELVRRTVPIRMPGHISVFSDNLRASGNPRPAHVLEDARILNEKAPLFASKYESFVRTCREAVWQ